MGLAGESASPAPGTSWQRLCVLAVTQHAEGFVSTRNYDDWTTDRWRLEPRLNAFELGDPQDVEQAPSLWKDLTVASLVALVLWATAAIVFG
jgi:hypothetical protein